MISNTYKSSWIRSLKSEGLLPIIEILDEVLECDWQFWERHYISLFRSWGFSLTNHDDGGKGGNRKYPTKEETLKKMSISHTGVYPSLETRQKQSLAKLGNKLSESTKEKLRIANTGKKMSKEAIEKTALANRGRKNTEEVKERIRQKLKGKKRDVEAVIKMAETNLKPVLQYDLEGNFIKEYPSIKAAKMELSPTNNGLSSHLKGQKKSWQGFIWKYK